MIRPTPIVADWYARAAADPARVVLADAGDPRADEATARLIDEGLAVPVPPEVDPTDVRQDEAVARAIEAGLDPDDPVVAATVLVRSGAADAAPGGTGVSRCRSSGPVSPGTPRRPLHGSDAGAQSDHGYSRAP